MKRIDSRGIAVYGDQWTKWAKLAEEMDRGDVDSTKSRHNESIGNFEQLSYSRTFLRKATSNTKGPSNIKNGERLARSSSAAPMIQGMEPLRRTGTLKRFHSRKGLLGHGIGPSSSHDSLEELAEGKGERRNDEERASCASGSGRDQESLKTKDGTEGLLLLQHQEEMKKLQHQLAAFVRESMVYSP